MKTRSPQQALILAALVQWDQFMENNYRAEDLSFWQQTKAALEAAKKEFAPPVPGTVRLNLATWRYEDRGADADSIAYCASDKATEDQFDLVALFEGWQERDISLDAHGDRLHDGYQVSIAETAVIPDGLIVLGPNGRLFRIDIKEVTDL